MRIEFLSAAQFYLMLCLVGLTQQASRGADNSPNDPRTLGEMVNRYGAALVNQLSTVSSLEYDTTIYQKETPAYAAFRTKYNPANADFADCLFKTHVCFDGELYSWSTVARSIATGRVCENDQGGWSGTYSQYVNRGSETTLCLAKGYSPKPSGYFVGRNSFFLPYSFLLADNNPYNANICTLSQLQSKAVWQAFKAAIKNISIGKVANRECLVVTVQYNPTFNVVVYLPISMKGPPLGFDYYALNFVGYGKVLTRQYRISSIVDDPKVFPIPYPSVAEAFNFMPMETSPRNSTEMNADVLEVNPDRKPSILAVEFEHRITGIKVNSIKDDSIFTIDPASVTKIYDMDTNSLITVPR